ncbi:MAG: cupin domain-containing protein [Pseudomonadales bacterium]|nr:cupin domain-containing protein [Pseudomonadales bacterium]
MPQSKTVVSHLAQVEPYLTKDRSQIRELMHPDVQGNQKQSLAQATVPVGAITLLHRHALTEELYYIQSGTGIMTLGEQTFAVAPGDTICIKPGTGHCIENSGEVELQLLCCCSPAYSHDDTEILD